MPVLNGKALIANRVEALRKFHADAKVPRAELDLSGGIDSAVMLGLLVEALGAENLTVVHTRINTNPEQTYRAKALAEALKVPLINIDLTSMFDRLVDDMTEAIATGHHLEDGSYHNLLDRLDADPTLLGSIRSCLRAPIGRGFNRMMGGGIRHGTGNECEDRFLRYYQKGGDGEVDTNPIEMLSKTEVFQLAYALGEHFPAAKDIYRKLITTKPSADLWGKGDEQTDEGELAKQFVVPFTYGRVNPETGAVLKVGTIERVARFLDEPGNERWLFHELNGDDGMLNAYESPAFKGFDTQTINGLVLEARRAWKQTLHKANDNIPTLGTRRSLVLAGILTNELPSE